MKVSYLQNTDKNAENLLVLVFQIKYKRRREKSEKR